MDNGSDAESHLRGSDGQKYGAMLKKHVRTLENQDTTDMRDDEELEADQDNR